METFVLGMHWNPARPRVLVVACSDGRLQEATDAFLERAFGIRDYDRLYLPGGAGALASSGCELLRAQQVRHDCRFLVTAHQVGHLILLLHGPTTDGPPEAVCADYRRKRPWATPAQVRAQQGADVRELLRHRHEFAGAARVAVYRLEVTAAGPLVVTTLHEDADTLAASMPDGAAADPRMS